MNFDLPNIGLGSENFIKLADKEKVIGLLAGETYVFSDHWTGLRYELCGGEVCNYCKTGNKPKTRFRVNMLVKNGDTFTAKIFTGGATVANQLNELNTEYPLENTFISIVRNGTGMNTSYGVMPVKDGAVSAKQRAVLDKIPLLELKHETASSDEKRPFGEKANGDIF